MFFRKAKKWEDDIKRLQNNEITIEELVNANEKKVLYYSTPFVSDEKGDRPNVLQTEGSDVMFFPAFTSISDLKEHMTAIGCEKHIVIKGDLKSVLDSLDSHPLIREWGVVIDPHSHQSLGIPPHVRVQPKCLR